MISYVYFKTYIIYKLYIILGLVKKINSMVVLYSNLVPPFKKKKVIIVLVCMMFAILFFLKNMKNIKSKHPKIYLHSFVNLNTK